MGIFVGKLPRGSRCPRCGSKKTYKSPDDFFCLTCSFIVKESLE